ncbi:MAG: hypothetical protein SGI86_22855 [Deltaproteobacteria bacterium]|nr:hypothetical protein [Deltaproteobacteria bacterium]
MKRAIAESWTRFVDDQPSSPPEGSDPFTLTPQLRDTLRSDLRIDALLRAQGQHLRQGDADAFVAAVANKIRITLDAARFTQSVRTKLRRQRSIRRIGVAAVLVALAAAAAWHAWRERRDESTPSANVQDVPDERGEISLRQETPRSIVVPSATIRTTKSTTTPRELLFVVGYLPVTPNDALLVQRFEGLGYRVTLKVPSQLSLTDGPSSDLVAIASSVESVAFSPAICGHLAALAVPLVVWEPWLFDDLGLSDCPNNAGCGWLVTDGQSALPTEGLPILTAGKNAVSIARVPIVVSFGNPHASATVIATATTDRPEDILFVYERNAELPAGPAPARRVALFLSDDTGRVLTDAGWALFDGAIEWAAGRSSP